MKNARCVRNNSAAIGGAATPKMPECHIFRLRATVVAIGFEVGIQVGPGRLELDLEST